MKDLKAFKTPTFINMFNPTLNFHKK